MVRLVGLQSEVKISKEQYKDGLHPVKNIGQEVFTNLESEREQLAELLQEDIVQLLAIAKMKLSGDTAPEVSAYLTAAINKLRLLTFELKPQILERFGLATALQTLLNYRLKGKVDHNYINLHQLPAQLDKLMEIAIFRLVQQIFNSLSFPYYNDFKLEILRKGNYIHIKTSFRTNTLMEDAMETETTRDKLINSVKSNMYLFNGYCHFYLSPDGLVEFSVYLDETNLVNS